MNKKIDLLGPYLKGMTFLDIFLKMNFGVYN